MKIINVVKFPHYTYIDLGEDFIRVNRTEGTFTYKGRDYINNETEQEFIRTIKKMNEEMFKFIIKGLNDVTLR